MTLYPNQESLDKLRELQAEGLKNVLKKDEDGYYVSFRRPTSKLMKGKVVAFTPPVVQDKDGQQINQTAIGNGSDVTVKLAVYSHKTPTGGKAKAARWEALRVDNLVPFEAERDFQEDQIHAISGMKDVKPEEQLF